MKGVRYIIILTCFLSACSNKDVMLPDYTYTSVYFPLQYPLRTLILGDDRADNSLDKKKQFNIGVSIGGLYKNNRDWNVDFVVDKTLVPANLTQADGSPVEVLPDNYYTLASNNKITIPSGSFNGLLLVQLTDAFFNDPLSATSRYVIPLRITGTSADSVLKGVPAVPNPNRHIQGDWDPNVLPRDYVLFGIKYINPYHGTYLHRGKESKLDANGAVTETTVYHQPYAEQDQLWSLSTTSMSAVQTNGVGTRFTATSKMTLTIDEATGNIVVSPVSTSPFKANGSGKYVKNAEAWGGVNHHAMYLEYTYGAGGIQHRVNDTLVFRDNGVVFEEIKVTVN